MQVQHWSHMQRRKILYSTTVLRYHNRRQNVVVLSKVAFLFLEMKFGCTLQPVVDIFMSSQLQ